MVRLSLPSTSCPSGPRYWYSISKVSWDEPLSLPTCSRSSISGPSPATLLGPRARKMNTTQMHHNKGPAEFRPAGRFHRMTHIVELLRVKSEESQSPPGDSHHHPI